jgi:hypothetical protein
MNAMQTPRTTAQASRPLTTAVPNEGLVSQKMRMMAMADIPTPYSDGISETGQTLPGLLLTCPKVS